jgi:UDP-glucose 4-epimerase
MKKITIIGSESFLARNFIKYLIDNHEVELKLYDFVDHTKNGDLFYQQINFNDLENVRQIDFNVDTIFFFIGKTGTTNGFDDYSAFVNVNELILLNFLQVYREKESKARVIYPSTRLIYKSNPDGMILEHSEKELKSIYAVTKYAAEQYFQIYKKNFGLNYVIIRICTPIGSLFDDYGNYGTFEIFENQARKNHEVTVYGDGLQKKTFTKMEDICEAFCRLALAESINHSQYNLGGQALTLLDIAEKIASDYDVPVTHVPWPETSKNVDGGSVVFDSARFDEEFGMTYNNLI